MILYSISQYKRHFNNLEYGFYKDYFKHADVVVGHNVVYDHIVPLSENLFDQFMKDFSLDLPDLSEDLTFTVPNNLEELVIAVLSGIYYDIDVEIYVYEKDLLREFYDYVKTFISEVRVGGQGGIAFTQFKALGAKCKLSYNEKLYLRLPKKHIRTNFVFERVAPCLRKNCYAKPNRIIVSDNTKDLKLTLPSNLSLDYGFFAGYHHVKNKQDILDAHKSLTSLNDGLYHVELSVLSKKELKDYFVDHFLRNLYGIGMNEHEYKYFFENNFDLNFVSKPIGKRSINQFVYHYNKGMYLFVKQDLSPHILDIFGFSYSVLLAKSYISPFPNFKDLYVLKEFSILESLEFVVENSEKGISKRKINGYYVFYAPLIRLSPKFGTVGFGDTLSSMVSFMIQKFLDKG